MLHERASVDSIRRITDELTIETGSGNSINNHDAAKKSVKIIKAKDTRVVFTHPPRPKMESSTDWELAWEVEQMHSIAMTIVIVMIKCVVMDVKLSIEFSVCLSMSSRSKLYSELMVIDVSVPTGMLPLSEDLTVIVGSSEAGELVKLAVSCGAVDRLIEHEEGFGFRPIAVLCKGHIVSN